MPPNQNQKFFGFMAITVSCSVQHYDAPPLWTHARDAGGDWRERLQLIDSLAKARSGFRVCRLYLLSKNQQVRGEIIDLSAGTAAFHGSREPVFQRIRLRELGMFGAGLRRE
jgi:hypothetical protein